MIAHPEKKERKKLAYLFVTVAITVSPSPVSLFYIGPATETTVSFADLGGRCGAYECALFSRSVKHVNQLPPRKTLNSTLRENSSSTGVRRHLILWLRFFSFTHTHTHTHIYIYIYIYTYDILSVLIDCCLVNVFILWDLFFIDCILLNSFVYFF